MDENDRSSDDEQDRPQPPASRAASKSNAVPIVVIVLGVVVGIGVLACGGLTVLLLPAVQKVREAADRAHHQNNMKQMMLAFHFQHDTHTYVVPALKTKEGRPGLSWRVAILPYLEQESLYQQFQLDEPWDSPSNLRLLSAMPKVYAHKGVTEGTSNTHFRVFVGGGAMFDFDKKTHFAADSRSDVIGIKDGLGNTIMIVEAAQAVPWTKPDELVFDPTGPLPELGLPGKSYACIAVVDGSVRAIEKAKLQPDKLRAAITANGGETLFLDW
jgi:hypothetical protein